MEKEFQNEESEKSPESSVTGDILNNANRKSFIDRELREMMFGFGDDANPYFETVNLMEDIVIKFIAEVTEQVMSYDRNSNKITIEGLEYYFRHDGSKVSRLQQLVQTQQSFKKVRKVIKQVKDM